jgi:hypothetical protein
MIGQSPRRKEDERLLVGRGRFVDDIQLPDLLHLVLVRSTHARARLARVDVSAARAQPGEAFTAGDLAELDAPLPAAGADPTNPYVVLDSPRPQPVLAVGEVRHVGEAIAVILATDRYRAADAADSVRFEYEPWPAVVESIDGTEAMVDGTAVLSTTPAPLLALPTPRHRRGGKAQRRGKAEVFLDAPRVREVQVRMAVGQPGEHRLAPAVDHLGAGLIGAVGGIDAGDAIVLDDQRGVMVHRPSGIGGDDGRVADDRPHASPRRARQARPGVYHAVHRCDPSTPVAPMPGVSGRGCRRSRWRRAASASS